MSLLSYPIFGLNKYIDTICLILFIIILTSSISSCSRHSVLLRAPDLQDATPALNTGFYTGYDKIDGVTSTEPGISFLGNSYYQDGIVSLFKIGLGFQYD